MGNDLWDDGPSGPTEIVSFDSGRSFGRGRGFIPAQRNTNDNELGGYNKTTADDDDGWNDSETNTQSYSGGYKSNQFDDHDAEDSGFKRGGGDFRRGNGRGRDGGRGRGGGRGGDSGGYRGRRDDDDDEEGGSSFNNRRGGGRGGYGGRKDDEDGDSGFRGRRGGGGGGGGGGRGGFGGRRGDDDDFSNRKDGEDRGDDKPEKPREIYIPPEPTDDEGAMFGSGISCGINFDKYDSIEVKVTGENVPPPISSFATAGLRQFVLENIQKSGYKKPTPVQKHAIPIVMGKRDLMACAQTGSGKTAAFLLPIINTLLSEPEDLVVDAQHCEPQAVIVSPTRELTLQIFNEARKFAHGSILKTVVVYGGTAVYHQAGHVMRGCHILVATPGRLLDFMNKGRITFSSLRFFVLDEGDRMLDLGFAPAVEEILGHPSMVPTGERQTLLFSATFPEDIQHLALKFLHNYLFLTVGVVGGACADVEQRFYSVTKFEKRRKLQELLSQENKQKTLVFVETKRTADFIAAFLSEQSFPTTSIHGDRLQREREIALSDFKNGRMEVLVATAVAARGLDIKDVAHVINYDLPKSIDEYVHRIGRTGRVGNRGRATSFYDSEQDVHLAKDLVRTLLQFEDREQSDAPKQHSGIPACNEPEEEW
ncbi:ATP-dependent RNA helicase vasa [Blattella germanica]|nr:ATP-dependent RNA helicase vasa [Blattella germanica]